MCAGISVYWRDCPSALVENHVLYDRRIERSEGGEPEVQFLYRANPRLIPAWHQGALSVFLWGSADRQSSLPVSGLARREDVEAGQWAPWHPELVDIPACLCLERGVWFHVREGVRGILVADERGVGHVYVLTEPATHYYKIMTRSDRMPVLIGERI